MRRRYGQCLLGNVNAGTSKAQTLQQLAGHADLTTTQRYADFDANDLRSAIECIDGNGVETGNRDTQAEPST